MSNIFRYQPDFKSIANDLNDYGFSFMPEIISSSYVYNLSKVVSNQDLWYKIPNSFHGQNSFLVPNLINKSEYCIEIATDHNVLTIADNFFMPGAYHEEKNIYQLDLMHGRVIEGQAPQQELHIDSRCCGITPPSHLHFFLYLDDCMSIGDGATRFVPGSHRFSRYSLDNDNTKAIEIHGMKGSLIVLNSAIYHGSSRKSTKGSRKVLTFAYSRWFIRQPFSIPYFKNWPRRLTDQEKNLFGFQNYAAIDDFSRISARGDLPDLTSHNE